MKFIVSVIILLILATNFGFSQAEDSLNTDNLIDAFDIYHSVLAGKRKVDTTKAKIGVPYYIIMPGVGYSQLKGFILAAEGNVSFYTKPETNLSVIQIVPEFTQNKQFTTYILANIWSYKNKYNFTGDWRFYNYNLHDYGLGTSNNSMEVYNTFDYKFLRLHQLISKAVAKDLFIGVGFNVDLHSNVEASFTNSNTNSGQYGIPSKTLTSGPTLNILYDTRRNGNNAVAYSWYANINVLKSIAYKSIGSNYYTLYADFRRYISFPRNSKNILAFWNLNWLTFSGKAPYFDLPSTLADTYTNMGRPFIESRYRGKSMIYFETEYRFPILKNELVSGALYVNSQEIQSPFDNSFSGPKIGFGGSLRTKMNKKSNLNLIISYGWGSDGASGIFFNLGEVF